MILQRTKPLTLLVSTNVVRMLPLEVARGTRCNSIDSNDAILSRFSAARRRLGRWARSRSSLRCR